MRKVELTMHEQLKYETIKAVADGNMTKTAAEVKLGIGRRQVDRLLENYRDHGKKAFRHKSKGKASPRSVAKKTKRRICELYLADEYCDSNLSHFAELLESRHAINLSRVTVAKILREEDIISPKAHRKTKKALKQELESRQVATGSKKEKQGLEDKIAALDKAHPNKSRKKYFGELIQMDASKHLWFGTEYTHLHIAIDDCTGQIVGAYFEKEETLRAYYALYRQILMGYGIPYEFLTDYRTVFEYRSKNEAVDTHTQFGYACKQLGTLLRCTFVPQAKGRVERVFGTLQSRLVTEMRIRGIGTIEAANEFLDSYIEEFNRQFACPIDYGTSVFVESPSEEEINVRLGILQKRTIDSGHHFKYLHEYFVPVDDKGEPVHYPRRTAVVVIKAYDGTLYASIGDKVHLVKQMRKHEEHSANFDGLPEPALKPEPKKYIPPMAHPWKTKQYNLHFERPKPTQEEWEDLWNSQANVLANVNEVLRHF